MSEVKTGVLYNRCYGGFSLSLAADARCKELDSDFPEYSRDIDRNNPTAIKVFHELGSEKFSGGFADIQFFPLKKGSKYRIDEYDGLESVEQPQDIEWSKV